MKKLLICLLVLGSISFAHAQNVSGDSSKWMMHWGVGMNNAIGYPSISLFDDVTESYRDLSGSLFIGRVQGRDSNSFFGLDFSVMRGNTIQPYQEKYALYSVMASSRRYMPISDKLNVWAGLSVGMGMLKNSYTDIKQTDVYRFLGITSFEGGFTVNIFKHMFVGIDASYFLAPLKKHDYEVPAAATKNHNEDITGFQFKLSFGSRF